CADVDANLVCHGGCVADPMGLSASTARPPVTIDPTQLDPCSPAPVFSIDKHDRLPQASETRYWSPRNAMHRVDLGIPLRPVQPLGESGKFEVTIIRTYPHA